jgi:hypothetical protein
MVPQDTAANWVDCIEERDAVSRVAVLRTAHRGRKLQTASFASVLLHGVSPSQRPAFTIVPQSAPARPTSPSHSLRFRRKRTFGEGRSYGAGKRERAPPSEPFSHREIGYRGMLPETRRPPILALLAGPPFVVRMAAVRYVTHHSARTRSLFRVAGSSLTPIRWSRVTGAPFSSSWWKSFRTTSSVAGELR